MKKYNVVLSGRIIDKIPKGEETIVSTHLKRTRDEKVSNSTVVNSPVVMSRKKIGMMNIIDHIGKSSGIDAGFFGVFIGRMAKWKIF
ncbi:hypothetical protein [Sellimonas sp.]|uniref:hypothetical protein n=1 Tax=Sellimonas sp. TaxID=2021466 RepID=UPI00257C2A38|nr:hypothetical protein [Sellimonas sp.]